MISLAVVLQQLGLTGTNATRDAVLQRSINGATATLGRELGRYLGVVASTVEIHDDGKPVILLHDDPVGTVTIETRSTLTAAWEPATTDAFVVDGRRVHNVYHGWHPKPPQHRRALIRCTYERGYAVDAGPAEFRDLVLELVVLKWRARGQEGMQSETLGDYSYTVKDLEKAAEWPAICRRWRRGLV